MTLQQPPQQPSDIDIESSVGFILPHFEEPLFPRKISTFKSNNKQFLVDSKQEIIDSFLDSNFVDCQINAYPILTEYKDFPTFKPDFLSIDIDRKDFKDDKQFENALSKTSKNIKEKLGGEPTVSNTGGGYHVYQPVYIETALENISDFNGFDKPSEQLLRFAKEWLSNGKADQRNNPSFKSCLIRVPGSMRSKYNNQPVQIIKKWNGIRVPITKGFIEEFRDWLIQKKIDQQKQRQKILIERAKNKNNYNFDPKYYPWIEHLLQTPIHDCRKPVIGIILAPYLINVRNLSFDKSYIIIKSWLDKCNELEPLDNYRQFDYRIEYDLKIAINKGIPPMTKEKIKTDPAYSELYQILKDKGAL